MASESDDLVLTELDLSSWARTVARRLEAQAEEMGVRLEVVSKGSVHVFADASSVDRIFDNLVSNAIKFNVRGGSVRIEVADDDEEARISIHDTGIGIPESERNRIFERFFQVDSEIGGSLGGTGIGLAIVKEAVERHGGRIDVESVIGKGASFHVYLPSSAILKDDTSIFSLRLPGDGLLVLLADPEESERAGERATLLADGFAVLTASSVERARRLVELHNPHAVLFDVRLLDDRPEGESGPLFPVLSVAMLPDRDPDAVKSAVEAGAVGTLLKPFKKEEFLFLLENALQG